MNPRSLSFASALSLTLFASHAYADDGEDTAATAEPVSSTDAKTDVTLTSDWPKTELINHLGTSVGRGVVGGRGATLVTVHLEKLCRAPCKTSLATEGEYYVDAPGMHPRKFELPAGSAKLDVRVRGASHTPLALSYWGVILGGSTALVGGLLWGIFGSVDDVSTRRNAAGDLESVRGPRDTSTFQTITFLGGGVLLAGIAGLILLPRTHVETRDGAVLDASASPRRSGPRFTAQGIAF